MLCLSGLTLQYREWSSYYVHLMHAQVLWSHLYICRLQHVFWMNETEAEGQNTRKNLVRFEKNQKKSKKSEKSMKIKKIKKNQEKSRKIKKNQGK